jgi:hypothetical protein
MFVEVPYDRTGAFEYAKTWALDRNSAYLNFQGLGGDCTNFASQCIFAGSKVMNYTPVTGWYYISSYNRTASWSGVEYLFNFLTSNKAAGPYAVESNADAIEIGDIVQLGDKNGHFYHSPVVTGITPQGILLAAHTYDAYMKPLDNYVYHTARYLHIEGVRKYA